MKPIKRFVVPVGLAAAVGSLVFSTVAVTAQAAPLAPGASTGRCDKLSRPDERRAVGAEVQMRLNARGHFLIVDGIVGPKTTAALTAWARATRYPAPARWTPDQVKVALFRLRAERPKFTVGVDKRTQRVRIKRNHTRFVAADLKTSTGHGQWYRGKRRDGSDYIDRALTPSGVYRTGREEGAWYESPLGCLYDPVFLQRRVGKGKYRATGIALHGSMMVTGKPASSGCVRLDPAIAAATQRLLQRGTAVWIVGPDTPARNTRSSV